MRNDNKSGTGLYFILGILIVAVAIFAFISYSDTESVTDIEPAAGVERPAYDNPTGLDDEWDNNDETGFEDDPMRGPSPQPMDNER
ncbi:MAG: hypothetical protein ACLFR0_01815 [Alphaproteobacteria bacterium]